MFQECVPRWSGSYGSPPRLLPGNLVSSTDETLLAEVNVGVYPLISEKSSQRRQRLDGTWIDEIPLRSARPVVLRVMTVSSTLTLQRTYGVAWVFEDTDVSLEAGEGGELE